MSAEFIHKSYVAHDGDDAPSLEEVEATLDRAAKAGIPADLGKAKPKRGKGAKQEGQTGTRSEGILR